MLSHGLFRTLILFQSLEIIFSDIQNKRIELRNLLRLHNPAI